MDLMRYVGERIRELRNAYGGGEGISQEKLAEALDLKSPNTVSRWETATYKPSIEDLEKLARFFGVSILTFFPKAEEPEDSKVNALLRAAEDLDPDDIDELRQYAEFRKARHLYGGSKRPSPGRKRGT